MNSEQAILFQRRRCLLILPLQNEHKSMYLKLLSELIKIRKRVTTPLEIILTGTKDPFWSEVAAKVSLPLLPEIPQDLSPYHSIWGITTKDELLHKLARNGKCLYGIFNIPDFERNPFLAACIWLRQFLHPSLYFRSLSEGEN